MRAHVCLGWLALITADAEDDEDDEVEIADSIGKALALVNQVGI